MRRPLEDFRLDLRTASDRPRCSVEFQMWRVTSRPAVVLSTDRRETATHYGPSMTSDQGSWLSPNEYLKVQAKNGPLANPRAYSVNYAGFRLVIKASN